MQTLDSERPGFEFQLCRLLFCDLGQFTEPLCTSVSLPIKYLFPKGELEGVKVI